MTAVTGAKPQQEAKQRHSERRREDLGVRYGAIGIASVAAACRYVGNAKNHAYAPVTHRVERRFLEAAAS